MFVCWGNQFTSTFSLPRKPKYGCNHDGCKMAFQTKDEYSLHLKFKHSDDNPLPVQRTEWFCPSCEVSFSNRKEHAYHLSVCSVNKGARLTEENSKPCATRQEPPHLYCPSCDYPFVNEESLTRHVYHCWGITDQDTLKFASLMLQLITDINLFLILNSLFINKQCHFLKLCTSIKAGLLVLQNNPRVVSTIGYDKRVAFSIEHVVRSQVRSSLHLNLPLTVCPRLILYHLYIWYCVDASVI